MSEHPFRFPVWQAVCVLLLLRLCIGWHFFSEGLDKVRAGNFTAAPFLTAATGPWAPYFHRLLDDPDWSELLCVQRQSGATPEAGAGRASPVVIDPERTIAIWGDFADRCAARYRFGDPAVIREITARRERLEAGLSPDANGPAGSGQADLLSQEIAGLRAAGDRIAGQPATARTILRDHVDQLRAWLDTNRTALLAHYSTSGRETAFERDGAAGPRISSEVESLRGQTGQIRSDRRREAAAWAAEVQALWDSLEQSLNGLAEEPQRSAGPVLLHRPHDQAGSPLKWINRIIPWFDIAAGTLLLVGLFPRFAALAAGLFLLSVIATQPPWVPGAAGTWPQIIELAGLAVLASALGRTVPGLGWLFRSRGGQAPVPVRSFGGPDAGWNRVQEQGT